MSEYDTAVSEKLTRMQADDWREVKAMDASQLDAFMDELNRTGRHYESTHPFVALRAEAVKAIKKVRSEMYMTAFQRSQQQQTRQTNIMGAAQRIREAVKLLEDANEIPDLTGKPTMPPSLDVASASDAQLAAANAECLGIVREIPSSFTDDAQAISLLKTPAAKAIAPELRARAQEYDERRGRAEKMVQKITAERQRRAEERAAAEAANTPEALAARIAELENKLAEIGAE